MSEKYVNFIFIRSFVSGYVPTLDDLKIGQIVLNVPDAKMYIRQRQAYGIDKIKLIDSY